MTASKTPWVVAGGKIGEFGHCERCGEGLSIPDPQRLEAATAAMGAFVKCHAHCKPGDYKEPKAATPQAWLKGRDTGISSCTIYAVMTNTPTPMSCYDVPHDPDDFGRCYRLLKLFPDWKARLPEVAQQFPIWAPLVREWDTLTAMYEAELASKDPAHPTYYFIQKLIKEGRSQ